MFITTLFFNYVVAAPEEPQRVIVTTIIIDDEEDLKPRPALDPDFSDFLKEFCKYEEIDITDEA